MLSRLLTFVLSQRLFIVILALSVAVAGVWAFRHLKLEAYPDISDTGVVVITQFPGFAAEEVEQQVTVPIERALNNTPYVIARRSRTIFGLSVVELTFAEGTDDYFARQVVLEKLRDAQLPEDVTPTLGPLSSGISEFYRYTLEGNGYDAMRLRELQDWVVTPRLLQVPGVADVTTFGGLVKQYQIDIDPRALDKYKLSMRQIADAVKNNNRNAGGALLELGQQSLAIRSSGLIQSTEDIENIVLDFQNGFPVFVRDLGRVGIGALPQTGIFGVNRQTSRVGGIEGIVLMRRWENPSEILQRIHAAVEELNATRLPPGARIVPFHDRTELVRKTLHTVSRVVLEGFLIVVTVLIGFFLNLRAALLTAIIVPLSLLFAMVCMYFSGVSLSLLSIGALDFGIIVDGTIVMVERILRGFAEPWEPTACTGPIDRIGAAAFEVARPILFSLLIIIAAYLPLLTLERVERRFDVVARFIPEARANPSAIGNLLIPTRDGARVPLSQLADIRVVNGATIIMRRENQRQITVRTNIRGRDQGGFAGEAQQKFAAWVKLPAGYEVTWGGQFENLERARQRLAIIIPITIALIFVFLYVTFRSALDAGLVLLSVPFSMCGGLVALYLRGIHLSVSAAVGFISLFGVAIMSGLLYISEIEQRRREPGASLRVAVILGAQTQFRPMLILILVAMLGMVPAAVARDIGSDIRRPLATVVIGGLLSALLLTLLALPAVYWLAAKMKKVDLAELQQAAVQLDQARLQATTDVDKAYQAYQSSQQVLQVYTAETLAKAEESFRIASVTHRQGATSLLELQEAQRTLNQTRIASNQASFDYRMSLYQLELATGRKFLGP